jgi:hypothetical protein
MRFKEYFRGIFSEPERPEAPEWPEWVEFKPGVHEAVGREIAGKPRLATVRSAPSREEFAAWRDHPVTQFVFAAYREQIATCEQSWLAQSWEGGTADQETLNELKARADTYAALEESDYEAFCEAVGVEPEPVKAEKEWAS